MLDYQSGNGQCIAVFNHDEVEAYCIYFLQGESIYGEEFVANSDRDAYTLFCGLKHVAGSLPVRTKCPPDFHVTVGHVECKPQGVTGTANIGELIRLCMPKLPHVYIEVVDTSLVQNTGVYDTDGNRVEKLPSVTVSTGVLTQILIGYLGVSEAVEQQLCQGDVETFNLLEQVLPKCNCHIIDEY